MMEKTNREKFRKIQILNFLNNKRKNIDKDELIYNLLTSEKERIKFASYVAHDSKELSTFFECDQTTISAKIKKYNLKKNKYFNGRSYVDILNDST